MTRWVAVVVVALGVGCKELPGASPQTDAPSPVVDAAYTVETVKTGGRPPRLLFVRDEVLYWTEPSSATSGVYLYRLPLATGISELVRTIDPPPGSLLQDDALYWISSEGLMRLPFDALTMTPQPLGFIQGMLLGSDATHVFHTKVNWTRIYRIPKGGGDYVEHASLGRPIYTCQQHEQSLLCLVGSLKNHDLVEVSLGTGEHRTIATGLRVRLSMAVDATTVYFAADTEPYPSEAIIAVWRGGEDQRTVSPSSSATSLRGHERHVYYLGRPLGVFSWMRVLRVPTQGGPVEILTPPDEAVGQYLVSGNHVYWTKAPNTEILPGAIFRSPLP